MSKFDATGNPVPALKGVSNVNGTSTVDIWADPSTHALLVSATGGVAGTQYATNAAYADGDIGTMALAVRDDALSTLTEADGDYTALRTNSRGAQWIIPDGNLTVIGAGSAGTANSGVMTVQGIASMTPVQVSQATGTNLHMVVDSGTVTTVSTVTTVTTLTGTTTLTPGTGATNLGKAEDGAHTSGDVGVMDLAVRNDTMADFSGSTNDYTPKSVSVKGQLLTANAPRPLKAQQITTITTSTSETTVLTQVASTFLDVYGVIVVNSSATASNIAFKDSTAGTTRFNIYVPAGDTRGFMLPMDAAVPQATVNTNWTATSSASVTSIIITMLAVKNV